jgi:hypothetical protein
MDDLFENIIQEKANKFFNSVEKTTKKNKKIISDDKKDEILNRLKLERDKRQQNIKDKKESIKQESIKQEPIKQEPIKQEPIKQDNNYMDEILKLKSELETIKKQKEEPKKEVKTYDKFDVTDFDLPVTKIEKPILPQKIKPTYVFSHFTSTPYY